MTGSLTDAVVTVPATVANLGPGFDIFAVALEVRNEVRARRAGGPFAIDPGPEAPEELRDPERNLVARAYALACEHLGIPGDGVRLECVNRIPFARGLGSSAAASLAGVLAAFALHSSGSARRDEVLACVTQLEGHSDNASAALLGGLSISAPGVTPLTLSVPEELRAVVFIPEAQLRTEDARRVVPDHFSRADAVFNASRCALLVRALALRDYPSLGFAMEDRWHQQQRSSLFPAMPHLIAAARGAGARGAALAGAGPSICALTEGETEPIAAAFQAAAQQFGVSGRTLISAIPNRGASVSASQR
ncbi:MAG TPA: homoserine kinase [Candidatus Sulfotelmatobacter sp.]|nr:homoserine kinase [Candidatus Sulfotelmatobacter sp.]